MNEIAEKIKIAFFPKRCEICGSIIAFDQTLCEDCQNHLPRIKDPVCKKCGCEKNDCICQRATSTIYFNGATAPFYYEGSVSRGILNLKEHEMPKLAVSHGAYISDAIKRHFNGIDFDFVTFVPMRKYAQTYRGFNQAELLAKEVSKNCSIPLVNALYKKRRTKQQKRQSLKTRFANMYDAFGIRDGVNVDDARILVIDDVKTTGATLSSIAHTLKANGAKSVYCATFAIVK